MAFYDAFFSEEEEPLWSAPEAAQPESIEAAAAATDLGELAPEPWIPALDPKADSERTIGGMVNMIDALYALKDLKQAAGKLPPGTNLGPVTVMGSGAYAPGAGNVW